VSLITQALYALVFCTRYLDIFTSSATKDAEHTWNFTLKVRCGHTSWHTPR
jgi:ER lumen protein retaining receptor